ncbi:hypothetical protein QRD40_10630 [Comamonas sp. Y6]|uniref:Uncharacterized protein n=1 Tax=Comamonas resistens TaxID=3046670 RepID=A0ABY8SWX3_9BURK|nr:hypothetical protein [Comamonas resistens]MDL5036801.1 hypothetical protein [Comamonas resistens]WHS67111.1 hypothetical protein QMY55_08345 [Comamonas resistens]
MRANTQIIMAESNEAASIQTVTGWVSSDGKFWGKDERLARYAGSTHHKCDKNPEHQPIANGNYCRECRKECLEQRWQDMPKEAYTPEALPLHLYDTDRYFFDAEDLIDWLEENQIKPEDVRLTKCRPSYPEEIEPNEHFCDILPEDGEVPEDVREAFEKLNEVLKKSEPFSWFPDDTQGVTLPADFLESDDATQAAQGGE